MKKIIPFSKELEFDTKIYEVTSISLEHSLQMRDKDRISGEFVLSGEYRINDISINKEAFNYNIPFNIELDERYITNNVNVDIDDFYYEVIGDKILKVNIDVLVDGLEIIEKEEEYMGELEEVREDEPEEVMDLFKEVDSKVVPVDIDPDLPKELQPILDTFDEKNETYVTYHVHIVRDNDNVESICLKYNISKDDLSNYNDLSEIKLGDKLIVPAYNNEKNK
jgi:hypothetical protein